METVIYEGRSVPKQHFRVVVYRPGYKMLVNSFEEYQEALRQGWHSSKEEAETSSPPQDAAKKPRGRRKRNGIDSPGIPQ